MKKGDLERCLKFIGETPPSSHGSGLLLEKVLLLLLLVVASIIPANGCASDLHSWSLDSSAQPLTLISILRHKTLSRSFSFFILKLES